MSDRTPVYRATGAAHVGSSGFVNHAPGSAERILEVLGQIFAQHPMAVVLDGKDDWYAPPRERPESIVNDFDLEPLAWFHAGTSGLSRSGVVLERAVLEQLAEAFETKHKRALPTCVSVYTPELVLFPSRVRGAVGPALVGASATGVVLRGAALADHPLSGAERRDLGRALTMLREHSGPVAVLPRKGGRTTLHIDGREVELMTHDAARLGHVLS